MSNKIKIEPTQAVNKLHAFLSAARSLESALEQAKMLKQARSIVDADVYLLTVDGHDYVLKTFRNRSLPARWLIGRRCLRNEFDKLTLIQTMKTVRAPTPYAMLDKDTMAMEFLENTIQLDNPEQVAKERYPTKDFFREVIAMIEELHQNNIAHGDLRRTNILIDKHGKPILIDFATTVQGEKKFFSWRRIAARVFINSDNYSLVKITKSFYPDLLAAEDLKHLHNPPWYLKLGRFWRRKIYRPYLRFTK